MKNIFIPFAQSNQVLICKGIKTSTLRSNRAAAKIGLDILELGVITINDSRFQVKCLGPITVEEAGGRDYVWKTEGFEYTWGPKFTQTKRWLDGIGKLWYYEINKL